MKIKLFLSLIIFFAFTAISPAFAQTSNEVSKAATEQTKLQVIKLKVSGINCSADCKDIQKEVSKMNGVTSCTLKGKPGATTAFEVVFDPTVVTEKDIRKIVEDTPGCTNPDSRPYKVKG